MEKQPQVTLGLLPSFCSAEGQATSLWKSQKFSACIPSTLLSLYKLDFPEDFLSSN